MLKKIFQFITKLLWVLFVLLMIATIYISLFQKEWIEAWIEWMKWFIETLWYWNYLIAFLSSLIESFPVLWGFLPWTNILLLVGGFFWALWNYQLIYIILISSAWAIIWNLVWYILWVYFWKTFFDKYWMYVGIGKTEVNYLEKWINKWGFWGIILWKFHPTTRTFIPFVAGTVGMKSGLFMFYNTIWSIIRSTSTVILGVFFVTYYKIILEYSWYIFLGIFALIWLYIYKYKRAEFKKYWDEKNAEIEEYASRK